MMTMLSPGRTSQTINERTTAVGKALGTGRAIGERTMSGAVRARGQAPMLPEDLTVLSVGADAWGDCGPEVLAERLLSMGVDQQHTIVTVSGSCEREAVALARAARLGTRAAGSERAMMLATASIEAAGTVMLALNRRGIAAATIDPTRVGPITVGRPLEAVPQRIRASMIARALITTRVLVLPAALGVDDQGRPTWLGDDAAAMVGAFVADRLATHLIELSPEKRGTRRGMRTAC